MPSDWCLNRNIVRTIYTHNIIRNIYVIPDAIPGVRDDAIADRIDAKIADITFDMTGYRITNMIADTQSLI